MIDQWEERRFHGNRGSRYQPLLLRCCYPLSFVRMWYEGVSRMLEPRPGLTVIVAGTDISCLDACFETLYGRTRVHPQGTLRDRILVITCAGVRQVPASAPTSQDRSHDELLCFRDIGINRAGHITSLRHPQKHVIVNLLAQYSACPFMS
ncbi:hypothetical protein BDV97DRAFT_128691 [Delphinella strobiligena]|nr:hypothetical protein BDV97DRAFT_128691 [Delphinella strobiligena]